jgi:DNA helicase-2/ATP-dependent DNA helicase PcrA
MENDEAVEQDKVTLMTLHGAKGLEFDIVFLPGWEEGLFPHQRALDDGGNEGLEEDRRLAYVGLTRARQRAIISYAVNRHVYGYWQSAMPSRFIGELPADSLEQSAPTGLYGAGRGSRFSDQASDGFVQPAWQRRQAPLIEGTAFRTEIRPEPKHAFSEGQRVFHQKFGHGNVIAVDGNKLVIAFDKAGTKTVIHTFVQMS